MSTSIWELHLKTPYLDGIRTHRGRGSSVIRPALYLQATTAGFLKHSFAGQNTQHKWDQFGWKICQRDQESQRLKTTGLECQHFILIVVGDLGSNPSEGRIILFILKLGLVD